MLWRDLEFCSQSKLIIMTECCLKRQFIYRSDSFFTKKFNRFATMYHMFAFICTFFFIWHISVMSSLWIKGLLFLIEFIIQITYFLISLHFLLTGQDAAIKKDAVPTLPVPSDRKKHSHEQTSDKPYNCRVPGRAR